LPAKSERQRKLFGAALAQKRGKASKTPDTAAGKIAEDMPEEKIRDFAKKALSDRIDTFIEKAKVYLTSGEEPPEGHKTQRGPKGGVFYETEGKDTDIRGRMKETLHPTSGKFTGAALKDLLSDMTPEETNEFLMGWTEAGAGKATLSPATAKKVFDQDDTQKALAHFKNFQEQIKHVKATMKKISNQQPLDFQDKNRAINFWYSADRFAYQGTSRFYRQLKKACKKVFPAIKKIMDKDESIDQSDMEKISNFYSQAIEIVKKGKKHASQGPLKKEPSAYVYLSPSGEWKPWKPLEDRVAKPLVKEVSMSECPTPGRRIRSRGKGRGLARGRGRGPIGVPVSKMGLADRIDQFIQKQHRIYLAPGEKPPKDAKVMQGPKGGRYYEPETKISSGDDIYGIIVDSYYKHIKNNTHIQALKKISQEQNVPLENLKALFPEKPKKGQMYVNWGKIWKPRRNN